MTQAAQEPIMITAAHVLVTTALSWIVQLASDSDKVKQERNWRNTIAGEVDGRSDKLGRVQLLLRYFIDDRSFSTSIDVEGRLKVVDRNGDLWHEDD
ncbi:hypothetical protein L596_017227 [Steinernema carpocapsae]|uniref:Uncharacterized protein n=1 Tax=Steinernema carpocapsae TaxID=34508 RepID=A0A4U5N195_STECR|nr:hypothetical protein L596_017227 [Steinernema carpocapsae]